MCDPCACVRACVRVCVCVCARARRGDGGGGGGAEGDGGKGSTCQSNHYGNCFLLQTYPPLPVSRRTVMSPCTSVATQ